MIGRRGVFLNVIYLYFWFCRFITSLVDDFFSSEQFPGLAPKCSKWLCKKNKKKPVYRPQKKQKLKDTVAKNKKKKIHTASSHSKSSRKTTQRSHFIRSLAWVIIFDTRQSRLFCSSNILRAKLSNIYKRNHPKLQPSLLKTVRLYSLA